MTTQTILIIGLENGTFEGWDLQSSKSSEKFPSMAAHTQPITSLHKYDHFLISGDACGVVKFWDFENNYSKALTEQVRTLKKSNYIVRPL